MIPRTTRSTVRNTPSSPALLQSEPPSSESSDSEDFVEIASPSSVPTESMGNGLAAPAGGRLHGAVRGVFSSARDVLTRAGNLARSARPVDDVAWVDVGTEVIEDNQKREGVGQQAETVSVAKQRVPGPLEKRQNAPIASTEVTDPEMPADVGRSPGGG